MTRLLTDKCPECVAGPEHPYYVENLGAAVKAWFRCHVCGWAWRTEWLATTLELPEDPTVTEVA